MKLFTKPDKSDAEAIACLENDEIVFQENNNRKYAPTHDILEDWALVKYVSSIFEDFPKPKDLFDKLGNEPAIRRAFRLWVEDYLIDNNSAINELIKATVSGSIDKYWADELLVAVFKSENCNSFFIAFEKELLEKDAVFFNRCLHIIKTCCKESDQKANNSNILLPIGSGWKEAIFFIQKHISQLDAIKLSIVNFLTDWYYRLLFQVNKIDNLELESAKYIVLIYLKEIEEEKEFWQEKNANNKSSILITILFDLASISKEEIIKLTERAFVNKENRDSWRLNSFYENVINSCLSGIGNQHLIKELPELIIDTAWKNWKYIPPKKEDFPDDKFGFFASQSLRDGQCWGIRDRHSFFPSGIYKTPFYNLLWVHPIIGLKFIIDFINYSIEFYVNATCDYKHKVYEIEIELNDGTKVKQWAAWELWAAYRGLSVTNNALESLLMSLEKFLLKTAKQKSDVSKRNINFIFDYVLKNSNNVAPLSVLTSVAIAYPEEVEDVMLPLLSIPEFYDWDSSRAIQESSALAPMDNDISFAQKVRWESNQLPHRKQFTQGLVDFIVDYQFNIRKINQQIHKLFDKLKDNIKEGDVMWKKRLNEIDIRNWEVQPYDKKLGGFVVQPKYEQEVVEHLASSQDYFAKQNETATYSAIISKAHKKEESISYEKWLECYQYYSDDNNFDIIFSKPITLAVLGLREFSRDISKKQKNWCLETIITAIGSILKDTFNRDYSLNMSVSLMEKEIALSSFHLLIQNVDSAEDINGIIATMIYMLFAPFHDHEIDKITKYVREEFFAQFPDEAKRVWLGLIKYSNYKKNNPHFFGYQDEEKSKQVQKNEESFVQQISSEKNLELNVSEINLDKSEGYLLARAFVITPYNTNDNDFSVFIKHFMPLLTEDLKHEETYSYNRNKGKRQIHHQSVLATKFYLAQLLLEANTILANSVLDLIIDPIYQTGLRNLRGRNDLFEFSSKVPELIIYKLDEFISDSNDEELNQKLITNFWNLWEHFFDKIKASGKQYFLATLFLDIKWKETATHWKPIENKKEFYKSMVESLGKHKPTSILNVLSTIGDKVLLPETISLLVEIFKSEEITTIALSYPSAERMIKRLFYNHISNIKNNKTLIEDYVWILNRMVDLGSSEAYLFRENVITYKKNES
ncbi:hypothetical protein SAMN05421766_107147 [Zobellia uliginosa]|uniref:ATP-binding protein n=1 Tax=Zobellia uliginosa TaxID=143224 RepID=A0ABY1L0U5_9FLAO|nr:hypothetical protein [Zobellia uliginosa]SIT03663.1 hypothetical protein SAMN05421766_107147 [Zobellia uliginosa]